MRRIALALFLLPALLLPACGSSSKSSDSGSSSQSSTTAVDTSKDNDLAQSLVLQAADYPTGWTTTPAKPDQADSSADKKLNDCTGGSGTADDSAKANGVDATKDNSQVSSSATIKKTTDAFQKDADALTLDKIQKCTSVLKQAIQAGMGPDAQGATIGDIKVESLSVAKFGDVSKGFRFTVQISAGGQTLPVYLDMVALGKDRSQIALSFMNVGAPFDSAVETALVAKAGAKLK